MRGKSLALLVLRSAAAWWRRWALPRCWPSAAIRRPTPTLRRSMSPRPTFPPARSSPRRPSTWNNGPRTRSRRGGGRQEDFDGRRARQKIYAGEPIIEPKLLARGQVPTDGMVPKGLRVVAIPVDIRAIQGGLVLPGSRCDVTSSFADPNLGIGETLCKTILQDIKVFAVNDITSTESIDPKAPKRNPSPWARRFPCWSRRPGPDRHPGQPIGLDRPDLAKRRRQRAAENADMTAREMLGAFGGGDRAKENPIQAEKNASRSGPK